jgi:hypothetical protein
VYDFDHTRCLGLFLDLNGNLLARPQWRDIEDRRVKLRQIKRFRRRHLLPVACVRCFGIFRRRLQGMCFSGHAAFAASRVPEFCATQDKKGDGLVKNFSSQGGGLALQFSQMKYPASSGKLVPSTFIFPDGYCKRSS